MIAAVSPAKTLLMGDRLTNWFEANRDGLMLGLLVGVALVALMVILRSLGRRAVERDPHTPPREVQVQVRHPGPVPSRLHIVIENDGPEFTEAEIEAFRRPGHSST